MAKDSFAQGWTWAQHRNSLRFSQIRSEGGEALSRSALWARTVHYLGFDVPWVLIHDLGCLAVGLGEIRGGIASKNQAVSETLRSILRVQSLGAMARFVGPWRAHDRMLCAMLVRGLRPLLLRLPLSLSQRRPRTLGAELEDAIHVDEPLRGADEARVGEELMVWTRLWESCAWVTMMALDSAAQGLFRCFSAPGDFSNASQDQSLEDAFEIAASPGVDAWDSGDELVAELAPVLPSRRPSKGVSVHYSRDVQRALSSEFAEDDLVFFQKLSQGRLLSVGPLPASDAVPPLVLIVLDQTQGMWGVRSEVALRFVRRNAMELIQQGREVDVCVFGEQLSWVTLEELSELSLRGAGSKPLVQWPRPHPQAMAEAVFRAMFTIYAHRRVESIVWVTHEQTIFLPEVMAELGKRCVMTGVFVGQAEVETPEVPWLSKQVSLSISV